MSIKNRLFVLCVPFILYGCGTKKVMVKDVAKNDHITMSQGGSTEAQKMAFVHQVQDNRVYSPNIVASMSFTAHMDGKDITVPGALKLKRDECIRLQLFVPLLGSEVGRVEFTPEYVLIIDRMNKQYIKTSYDELAFLRQNDLNFYSLQALFWDELMLPGTNKVGEGDLNRYKVDWSADTPEITLRYDQGKLHFRWKAGRRTALLEQAQIRYQGGPGSVSTLYWKYGGFKPVGTKMFPTLQDISVTTSKSKKPLNLRFKLVLNGLKTSGDWETESTVSSKYKQVNIQDILGKLFSL